MVDAVAGLLEGGRVKLYCVDSFDSATWSNASLPLEARAREHARYESWILEEVLSWIPADRGGPQEIATAGVSLGAYHAVNFALKRADRPRSVGCHLHRMDVFDGPHSDGETAFAPCVRRV
jgi:esterase/lipase superfamily enzyme